MMVFSALPVVEDPNPSYQATDSPKDQGEVGKIKIPAPDLGADLPEFGQARLGDKVVDKKKDGNCRPYRFLFVHY